MIIVEPAHPKDPQPAALLAQSHALMTRLFPKGACHFLDLDALCADHIRFFIARDGAEVLGTGALALMDGYGEVKSLFTAEAARGRGVAAAILRTLEDVARAEGLPVLKLETGSGLDAAHRLYRGFEFKECGPFGTYAAGPYSKFFTKALQ